MPQPTFHMLLAHEVLDRWNGAAPFATTATASRNAFLHGAIGPDMGFFPGANRLISELAHTDRAGDLTSGLAEHARSDVELAYAYGWATHIVADAVFHPHINATAARLEGCAITDKMRIQSMHIRLEIGLDLVAHRRQPSLQRIRLVPFLHGTTVGFFTRAFAEIHGVDFLPPTVVSSHKQATRFFGPMMALQATMLTAGADRPKRAWNLIAGGARLGLNTLETVARSLGGARSEVASFLRPLPLGPEFIDEVTVLVQEFLDLYRDATRGGLSAFPNYDVQHGGIVASPAGRRAGNYLT